MRSLTQNAATDHCRLDFLNVDPPLPSLANLCLLNDFLKLSQ